MQLAPRRSVAPARRVVPRREDLKAVRARIKAEQWLGFSIPIALFFAGIGTWLFPTNAGFAVGLAVGTATGCLAAYLILFRQNTVRLSWLMATGLLLGYAGGAFNTEIGLTREGTNLADQFGRLQSDLSFAVAIVMWVCAGLFAAGGALERPLGIRLKRISKADRRLVWMAVGLVVFCFVTGYLVFNGMQETSDQHITVLGDFGAYFCNILPAITIILLGATKWRLRIPVLVLLILVELGLLMILGRRVLIYGIAAACLSASLIGFRLTLSWTKKIVFAAATLAIVYVGMHFFYAMRLTQWQLAGTDASLTDIASGAFELVTDKNDTTLNDALTQNVRDRTSIIIYLSDLLAASKTFPPLYGKDFLYAVRVAIPSVFYPDKPTDAEEVLTNPQFGLLINDDPNSVLTSGISDFGVLGCVAYPFLLVIVFRVILAVLRSRLSEAAFVIALAQVVMMFLQAEVSLPGYVTLTREIVMVAVLVHILKKWPVIRKKKAESQKLLSLHLTGPRAAAAPVQF